MRRKASPTALRRCATGEPAAERHGREEPRDAVSIQPALHRGAEPTSQHETPPDRQHDRIPTSSSGKVVVMPIVVELRGRDGRLIPTCPTHLGAR